MARPRQTGTRRPAPAARPDRYERLEPFAKVAFFIAAAALAAGAAQWVWNRIFN